MSKVGAKKAQYQPIELSEEGEVRRNPTSSRNILLFAGIAFTLLLFFASTGDTIPILGHDDGWSRPSSQPTKPCNPGILGNISSQLPFKLWNSSKGLLPYYSNFDISKKDQWEVKNVVIVAHGFSRNANDYYCAAIDTLLEEDSSYPDGHHHDRHDQHDDERGLSNTLIITAAFLAEGDVCWDVNGVAHFTDEDDCGLPLWSKGGWISGLKNINTQSPGVYSLYSYDVFNVMIDRLMDSVYFPAVDDIRMFGFSAGAQTTMRYIIYPQHSDRLSVKTILGDPSTFIYFNEVYPS